MDKRWWPYLWSTTQLSDGLSGKVSNLCCLKHSIWSDPSVFPWNLTVSYLETIWSHRIKGIDSDFGLFTSIYIEQHSMKLKPFSPIDLIGECTRHFAKSPGFFRFGHASRSGISPPLTGIANCGKDPLLYYIQVAPRSLRRALMFSSAIILGGSMH